MNFRVLAVVMAVSACVTPGPFVRVATATAEEMKAAEDQEIVWYEFQEGDVVPFHLLFYGVLEGAADATPLRAKKKVYFVMRKNQPMLLSFDGKSFAMPQSSQSIITVLPSKNGSPGASVGWFHYIGESGNPEAEMKSLLDEKAEK